MFTNVTIGNGKTIPAQRKGDIIVLAFANNQWTKKHILDVLYVPEIHFNLFSSGKAMDRGYQLQSNNKHCELLKNNKVVAVGVRHEKLYRMLFKVVDTIQENTISANVVIKKESIRVWHERLGHQRAAHVKKILLRKGISFIDEHFTCEACVYGKHHRSVFTTREEVSKTCGEIIHADVCGPMEEDSLGGSRYFLLLKDDFSHFRHVSFLSQKSEAVSHIKNFIKTAQKEQGHNIRVFRSDNGTEFVNSELNSFLKFMGIQHQRTVPYTPQQNGCAEREMRTIVESTRTMLHAKKLEKKFWAEAVNTAVYILNRTGNSNVEGKCPFELWYRKSAKIDHLRIFGSEVFIHIPKEKRCKLDPKATKCMFLGYDNTGKAFRVWNPQTHKVEIARDIVFLTEFSTPGGNFEEFYFEEENTGEKDPLAPDEEEEPIQNETEQTPEDQIYDGKICSIDGNNILKNRFRDREFLQVPRRRLSFDETTHAAMLAIYEEPKSYQEAIESCDHKQWERAMDEEYESLIKNRTWILVKPTKDQKVIDNRWVYKLKHDAKGSVDRYKARLVVRSFICNMV